MAAFLVFVALLLSFPSFSSPLTANSVSSAAGVLSHSGYTSMALTLEFAPPNIIPIPSPSLTIFAPPDSAFSRSGQPSLSLLQFHFSPLYLAMHSIKSLLPGTKIPTLLSNHSIIVSNGFSVNGARINNTVIYDDGSLVIFGIDGFLDPNFEVFGLINGRPLHSFGCPALATSESRSYEKAIRVLRLKGFHVMAWFLALQLVEIKRETRLTIFSPIDDDLIQCYWGKRGGCSSIFRRHLVPCRMTKADLLNLDSGVELPTYVEGFRLQMRKFGGVLVARDVTVQYPDLYADDWLVVHGLQGSFVASPSSSSSNSLSRTGADSNGPTNNYYLFWSIQNYFMFFTMHNHIHVLMWLTVVLVLIW